VNSQKDPAPEPEVRTVLVVEDEVLIRMVVAEALRDAGFGVIEAKNADEAIDYLKSGGVADLVFTDVEMPGAANGIDFVRWLQNRFPKIIPILTSSGARAQEARSLGSFIAKPYKVEELIARIRTAIANSIHD
jgi:CheY-like chemotaxis protein